jgi:hypothetical protein
MCMCVWEREIKFGGGETDRVKEGGRKVKTK